MQGGRVTARIQNITVNNHNGLPERIQSLLQKSTKLTRPRTEQPLASNTRVTHVIVTGDNAPTYAKVRQLSKEKYEAAKQEFTELLRAGIIINFYLLRTFFPHLGSFCVVSSFTTFRPNFTSGLLQVINRDLG